MPTLSKSYSLTSVRGLTAAEVSKLKRAGIDSTKELLAATTTRYAEQKLARTAGLSLTRMREAVNRADLLQLSGVGPATADLIENIGVNSSKELATRRADTLWKTIETYVKAHPELNFRLPSPSTVASLVEKAKAFVEGSRPPSAAVTEVKTLEGAVKTGEAALHKYVDEVLFSNHPDGESFREACLSWRPSTEWDQVKARVHSDVSKFFTVNDDSADAGYAEQRQDATGFLFVGRMFGLYTELHVQTNGTTDKIYVEID